MVDHLGYRVMTLVFVSLIMFGQFIICFGMNMVSLNWVIFGRFIFGIGGESLNISVNFTIIYKQF